MGIKERRERQKETTRQAILDAARELFVSEGYEQVTMRKIAERIEYSPTAIYVHFADKDALMTELSLCDFHEFTGHFKLVPTDLGALQRLYALGRNYVAFGLEHPNQYRLLFMTCRPLDAAKGPEHAEDTAYELLVEAVKVAIAEGVFAPQWKDPHLVAQTLWGALHGLVALHLVMPAGGKVPILPIETLTEATMRLLMAGYGAAPVPAEP